MKKIISIVGARPNFMKIAPIYRSLKEHQDVIEHKICHTGQHFDNKMSKVFFDELDLPKPDFFLDCGGGSHADQTARIMVAFEKVLIKENPDLIIVVGDVNSTIACALVASKMGVKVAHIEAGLRSFDRSMPEEINRILTDSISDLLFVTEEAGMINLGNEGHSPTNIHFTGNVMIDNLYHLMPKIDQSGIMEKLNVKEGDYYLLTFHRPANVDNPEFLHDLSTFVAKLAKSHKIIFPVHPRTQNKLEELTLLDSFHKHTQLLGPLPYIDFNCLVKNSYAVVTDSGGIQEESTFMGVPCFTVRENTERPITCKLGTNYLAGVNLKSVLYLIQSEEEKGFKEGSIPPYWDTNSARRIVNILCEYLEVNTNSHDLQNFKSVE